MSETTTHLVIGAGPVGSTIATMLADRGTDVTVMTRSGAAPAHARITAVAGDATSAESIVSAATRGGVTAAAIYNCVNPPYHQWPTAWPPLHRAMLDAAERTGAVLVMTDNLYAFGPDTSMPMRESSPMTATGKKGATRRQMAEQLLAAHAAGRVQATLVRASDFFGPGVRDAAFGERCVPRAMQGRRVSLLGALDVPHAISFMPDVAATLIAAATTPDAWGRPWHVPNAPAMTQRQFVEAVSSAAGTTAKVASLPKAMLTIAGVFVPLMRELKETAYQFDKPWQVDATATQAALGVNATPMDEAVQVTVDWWRQQKR
jgi:nucleoside-diphosphate-sugar epimerase